MVCGINRSLYQSISPSIILRHNRSTTICLALNQSLFQSVFCSISNAPSLGVNQSCSQAVSISIGLVLTHLQDVARSPSRSISLLLGLSLTVLMRSRSPASFAFQVPWPFVNLSWILGLLLLEKSRIVPSEHVENDYALSHHFGHTVIMP